jgi:subtilisin family serine protease
MGRRVLLSAAVCAALLAAVVGWTSVSAAGAVGGANYIVLYKSESVPANAAKAIQQAGGTLVYAYDQIGVAVASSSDSSFRSKLLQIDPSVENAAATAGFATQVVDDQASGPPEGDLPNAPATDSDSLSGLQWDMRQIHTPQAHAITGGSPAVLVGDIDTGVDFNHPDLRQNVDVADSANCVSGAPVAGLAAQDDNGHGTHTAGTIAAASNGFGIVGVAPNVRIAAIKAGDAAGFFFPESVVCAFVWAGTHGVDVTNNSYFADPFLFNCRNDPVQRAIWIAEQRAIRFAMDQGTTVVAAEGNQSDDLSHPTQDVTSPDNTTPETRAVTNACVVIPVEIPGVIGVTADGNATQGTDAGQYPDYLKSFYSSYGSSSADVVAPGGDSLFGHTAEAPNGRVLSTWPAGMPCTRSVQEPTGDPTYPTAVYCYLQGTSMASPHVAGVAALIVSLYGSAKSPQNGKLRPGEVSALLQQTADPQECPETLPPGYASFVATDNGAPQTCTGGPGHDSWYGAGQVDALNAVTHNAGNH